jgi:hypothetical protein
MKTVPAQVLWLTENLHGRLPAGNRYSTVSRFDEDQTWPSEAWSIVLEFDVPPEVQGNPSLARARFLSPEGPHDRLKAGAHFGLYEGLRKVADVMILES